MVRADEDTEEYAATEEYEEDTEEYVKEYTRIDYEKQKVARLASGRRHEQAVVVLGGVRVMDASSRGMKRSASSEVYFNEDVDVPRCVPPVLVDQKSSRRQQGCASTDEDIVPDVITAEPACAATCLGNLPQQPAFVPSEWPEGESLLGPIIPSSRMNCRPCVNRE